MIEIWKDIQGFENMYQISNLGQVRSLKLRKIILKPRINNGYVEAVLSGKSKLIHRLVLETFDKPQPNLEVNHKDFNKSNNCLDNLEWKTKSANCIHAVIGNRNSQQKLTKTLVTKLRSMPLKRGDLTKLSSILKIGISTLSQAINKKSWSHL